MKIGQLRWYPRSQKRDLGHPSFLHEARKIVGWAMAGAVTDRSTVEQIVRQVALEYLDKNGNGKAPVLTVQTSSRHMHVCREDMDVLFGPGSELTFDRPLFQEGNFAAKETVTIVGPRNRLISNLRIL